MTTTAETTTVKDETYKRLVNQTSDSLYSKLENGKFFGSSKNTVLEILEARKASGKFNKDLSKFKEKPKSTTKEVKISKPKSEKPKKEVVMKKTPKVMDFEPTFEIGQEVKFTPYRQKNAITGIVVKSYIVTLRESGKTYEAVRIKIKDGKTFEKKASKVEKV